MNKEVNFEIAKLLKDKEFMDKNMYGEVRLSQPKFYDNNGVIHNIKDAFEKTELNLRECYNAPTIAEVVMWLYEKHGIWINVASSCDGKEWYSRCMTASEQTWGDVNKRNSIINAYRYYNPIQSTQTEAYEAAITYTLTKLI